MSEPVATVADVDLDQCAKEPIRIPGGIQPHGALVVADPVDLRVLQASANLAGFLDGPAAAGEPLHPALIEALEPWLASGDATLLRTVAVQGRTLQLSAHRSQQGLLVELEPPPENEDATLEVLYPRLRTFMESIDGAPGMQGLAELAVRQVRDLTGFDRIMLYSFDEAGTGRVLAEDGNDALPSYLDHRFPGSDIPPQARELYLLNRLRLIPDAGYQSVPIQPALSPVDGKPLDLSFAALRSVSPVHLEYMRNMGTWSSMSISIVVDGGLWGLISCHHAAPRVVNAQVRTACDFLGQVVSLQIGARERAARAARRIALSQVEADLLARLSRAPFFQQGLAEDGDAWLGLVGAQGAALVTPDHLICHGSTPSQPELQELVAWLHRRGVSELFATDSLAGDWPQASAFAGVASGLLAISISQIHPGYIMWFREEVVRTIKWAGDPRKPMESTAGRLHPRLSFDMWKEQVHLKAPPWTEVEIDCAKDFRNAIVGFVLRGAEERAALSEQLRVTNKELESFSYSVSHDLRAPFRHIVGYAELLSEREKTLDPKSRHYLDSIVEAALSAGRLVDDLLNFSQLGRTSLSLIQVDMKKLVAEVRRALEPDLAGRNVEWRIGDLPPATADAAMLRQVLSNLIDNAVKYSAPRVPAVITIEGEERESDVVYRVSDNGVGFDMAYSGKLFGVFQRLHRAEEFPGTGIGLALTKRIVERHGGSVFAQGALDAGATVGFSLPKPRKERTRG